MEYSLLGKIITKVESFTISTMYKIILNLWKLIKNISLIIKISAIKNKLNLIKAMLILSCVIWLIKKMIKYLSSVRRLFVNESNNYFRSSLCFFKSLNFTKNQQISEFTDFYKYLFYNVKIGNKIIENNLVLVNESNVNLRHTFKIKKMYSEMESILNKNKQLKEKSGEFLINNKEKQFAKIFEVYLNNSYKLNN